MAIVVVEAFDKGILVNRIRMLALVRGLVARLSGPVDPRFRLLCIVPEIISCCVRFRAVLWLRAFTLGKCHEQIARVLLLLL